jgi:hypothetical protein
MTNKRKYIMKTKKRSSKNMRNKRTKKLRGGFSWPWSNTNTNTTDPKPSFFNGWFSKSSKDCSEADCAKYLNKPISTDANLVSNSTFNSPLVADNKSFSASEEASVANFSDEPDENYNVEEKRNLPPDTPMDGGKRKKCIYGCSYCKRYNCKCQKCTSCKYKLKKYSKKRKH